MKKILIITTICLLLTSCEKWLDVNDDPNYPKEGTNELSLPAAQGFMAVRLGGNLFNIGGFFAQYWSQAPESNQYNDIETYDLRTDILDDDYEELFSGALMDLQQMIYNSKENNLTGDLFVANVLKAYIYQYWIDMIDMVPYSEAFQGLANLNPMWESGQNVYDSLIFHIDKSIDGLNELSVVSPSDMLLNADLNEWIGFANAVKLKLYMRQRFVRDVSSEINELITENNFMSDNVSFSSFEDAKNKRNPWYETTQQLNTDANHVATINIISYLKSHSDPRMNVLFRKAANTDSYEGTYPAVKQIDIGLLTGDFSRPNIPSTYPVYLYTMAELNLFIAEAELMINNDKDAAKAAFDTAVYYGLELHGVDTVDLVSNGQPYFFDVNDTNEDLFEQIMMQKWVALCLVNNLEAWCELRRTDIPRYFGDLDDYGDGLTYISGQYLNPAKNVLSETGEVYVPTRLPYPDVAQVRNVNTPRNLTGTTSFTEHVWWDID